MLKKSWILEFGCIVLHHNQNHSSVCLKVCPKSFFHDVQGLVWVSTFRFFCYITNKSQTHSYEVWNLKYTLLSQNHLKREMKKNTNQYKYFLLQTWNM